MNERLDQPAPALEYASPSSRRPVILHHDDGVSITFPPRDAFQRGVLIVANLLPLALACAAVVLLATGAFPFLAFGTLMACFAVLFLYGARLSVPAAFRALRQPATAVSVSAHGGGFRIDDPVCAPIVELRVNELESIAASRWWLWPARGQLDVQLRRKGKGRAERHFAYLIGYPLRDIREATDVLSGVTRLRAGTRISGSIVVAARPTAPGPHQTPQRLTPCVPRTMLRTDTEERMLRDSVFAQREAERRKARS